MTNSAITAAVVVFDLGGVVVRIARSWRDRAIAAGLPLHQEQHCERALTHCWDAVMALQRGEITTAELARRFCEHSDGIYDPEQVVSALNSQLLGEHPGVLELIEKLVVPHAIFSNTSADHWQMLLRYRAVQLARWRLASFQIGVAKPEPRAYAAVERAVGEAAERLLFFDDNQQNVNAARQRGWQSERIDPFTDVATQLRGHLQQRGLLSD